MTREIDDLSKRAAYKKERFGDKKSTIDDYTGKRIFAGNKQDSVKKHPTTKTTDVDHVVPIDVVEKKYPFLTPEEQKEIVNNQHNLAVTNSKLNRSKGNSTNQEYLYRQLKKGKPESLETSMNMLEKGAEGSISVQCGAAKCVANAGVDAVKNASVELFILATENAIAIAKNEKDCSEAVQDVAGVTAGIFAMGAADKILFQSKGVVPQVVAVAYVMKDSFMRYLNNEIDEKEFINEVAIKSAPLIAGKIAGMISGGNILVQLATTYACTLVCNEIIKIRCNYKSISSMQTAYLESLDKVYNQMVEGIHIQQNALKDKFEEEQLIWNQVTEEGFDQIFKGAVEYDMETISSGLDQIMGLFGTEIMFKTTDDIRDFMSQDTRIFSL